MTMPAATDLEASLRYCGRQLLHAQELAKPGFMTLCAVRSGGDIVDFEWDYVNCAAARMFLGTRDRMIGQRLLDSRLGHERLLAVFALYRRIAEGLPTETLEHEHVGKGIDGLIRHVAIRLGDGVAVTLSNRTAVARADALRVELMRHRTQLQPPARSGDPHDAALTPRIDPRPPQPPVRVDPAIRWRVFATVGDVLGKFRPSHLGALAARSFGAS